MIISSKELKEKYGIFVSLDDAVLQNKIDAIEIAIRKATNNKFQNRCMRWEGAVRNNRVLGSSPFFKVGDTVEISRSLVNDGLYVIEDINDDGMLMKDAQLFDMPYNMITRIIYPKDVVDGVISMLKWQERNEKLNDENSEKPIQSETISRHSVTYATDTTDLDIDRLFGVPYKYTSFLKRYMKARF